MSSRKIQLPNQFLQSLAVGFVAFVVGAGAWYLLWPYDLRSTGALAIGLVSAVFCSAASWMRSHDDKWEASHLRTLPLLSPKRLKRENRKGKSARAETEAEEPSRKSRKEKKAAKKAAKVPGFDELANVAGRASGDVTEGAKQ